MKYIWVFILSLVVSLSLSTVGRRTINDNFLLGFLASITGDLTVPGYVGFLIYRKYHATRAQKSLEALFPTAIGMNLNFMGLSEQSIRNIDDVLKTSGQEGMSLLIEADVRALLDRQRVMF